MCWHSETDRIHCMEVCQKKSNSAGSVCGRQWDQGQHPKTHQQSQESHPKESWWAAEVPWPRPLCLCLERLLQLECWLSPPTGRSERQKKTHRQDVLQEKHKGNNTREVWFILSQKCRHSLNYYLSNQVVFCVGHVHSVPFNGQTLGRVKGSFEQVAILSPAFRP